MGRHIAGQTEPPQTKIEPQGHDKNLFPEHAVSKKDSEPGGTADQGRHAVITCWIFDEAACDAERANPL